jgi:hypothetical protein
MVTSYEEWRPAKTWSTPIGAALGKVYYRCQKRVRFAAKRLLLPCVVSRDRTDKFDKYQAAGVQAYRRTR